MRCLRFHKSTQTSMRRKAVLSPNTSFVNLERNPTHRSIIAKLSRAVCKQNVLLGLSTACHRNSHLHSSLSSCKTRFGSALTRFSTPTFQELSSSSIKQRALVLQQQIRALDARKRELQVEEQRPQLSPEEAREQLIQKVGLTRGVSGQAAGVLLCLSKERLQVSRQNKEAWRRLGFAESSRTPA